MSGIAGAIGSADAGLLELARTMSRAQEHRGPDGDGEWVSDADARAHQVAFGHRRLAIFDRDERAAQPLRDPESGTVLIHDGEIYNWRDLRAELARTGWSFRTESDAEVVLAAYVRWGVACVERLRGIFAFAVWDPSRDQVFLARDRLGVKPLYVAEIATPQGVQTILFASELRALLATGKLKRRLDPMGVSTYLWNGFVSGPRTIVAGARLLPAGARATVRRGDMALKQERWWSLPRAEQPGADPAPTDATRGATLSETLVEAVGQQLASDVPLGVLLSGGIDSSAVAGLAVQADRAPVRTFNVAFEGASFDESPHARAVAAALGTEHTELRFSQSDVAADLDRALGAVDQPTFDGLEAWFLSRAARQAGVAVALAGTGGDELFGGSTSFAELPRVRRYGRLGGVLPESLVRRAADLVTRRKLGPFGDVPPQTWWGRLGDALATRGHLVDLYQVAGGLFSTDFWRELVDADRVPPIRLGLPRERRDELEALVADQPALHAISNLELAGSCTERLLRDTDAAGMDVSLEVRVPLLDHEVVERVARLDETARFQPLGAKDALRRTGLADLDPKLFERAGPGPASPVETWCRDGLRADVESVLLDRDACESVGVRPEPAARLWRSFLDGAPGVDGSRVWALFVLMRWSREHKLRV